MEKAAGVIEAKKVGSTILTGREIQSAKYSEGLPDTLPAYIRPLLLYESTGVETHFTSFADPEPKSRYRFNFHRLETLADWISPGLMATSLSGRIGRHMSRRHLVPTNASRTAAQCRLWKNKGSGSAAQIKAIKTWRNRWVKTGLACSLFRWLPAAQNLHPAINSITGRIRFAEAKRVLLGWIVGI